MGHPLLGLGQLGEGRPHLRRQGGNQVVEEGLLLAELVAVADGAANDAAQDITPPLVARGDAIDDEEGGGADVVGDDPQGLGVPVRRAGQLGGGGDEPYEEVDLVIAVDPLHDRRQALQAHAGVHRGLGQGAELAAGVAVELHEDQVPDLDVAVAVGIRRTGRATGDPGAMVVEDLGTGTAGAGIAHGPEVVLLTAAGEAVGVDADLVQPDGGGLVVVLKDGDPEALGGDAQDLGQVLPGIADGVVLEVIAKAEVAQHLEKGVVTGGVADVLQVIVLAAGPHAALGAGGAVVGALVPAEKDVLELDHAGVGEQQGRVVGRHQGTAGHHLVTVGGKVIEETGSQLGTALHDMKLIGCSTHSRSPRR